MSGSQKFPLVKPLSNRILVKRSKPPLSKGGILLPESAQEKPREGEVFAIGPGKRDEEGKWESMEVQVGDRVLFGGFAGTAVATEEGDEEWLILSEDEVMGILV